MARYALIDGYLDTMRDEIRWRRDLDDLVSEMEDHLYTAVEGMISIGVEPESAQRTTLDQFGEPKVLATAYASTNTGGLSVPTSFTKSAGNIAFVSAALFIVGLIGLVVSILFPDRSVFDDPTAVILDGQTVSWMLTTFVMAAAGAALVIVMVALHKRVGGAGLLGLIGIAVTSLGVAATIVLWAFGLWLFIMASGTLIFALAVLRRDVAPSIPMLMLGGGMTVGAIVFFATSWIATGSPVSDIDTYAGALVGFYLGVIIVATGLVGIGRWLASEEPADIDTNALIA